MFAGAKVGVRDDDRHVWRSRCGAGRDPPLGTIYSQRQTRTSTSGSQVRSTTLHVQVRTLSPESRQGLGGTFILCCAAVSSAKGVGES